MNQLWQVKTDPTLANVISALQCADLAARRRRDLISAIHTTAGSSIGTLRSYRQIWRLCANASRKFTMFRPA